MLPVCFCFAYSQSGRVINAFIKLPSKLHFGKTKWQTTNLVLRQMNKLLQISSLELRNPLLPNCVTHFKLILLNLLPN